MVAGKIGCLCIAFIRSAFVFITGFESGNFFFNIVDAIVIFLLHVISFESNKGEDGFGTGVCFGGNGMF